MRNVVILLTSLVVSYFCSSCNKFLDEKSDVSLSVPNTLEELEALMNYYTRFVDDPTSGEIATDDFFINDIDFNSLSSEDDKNNYVWSDEVFLIDNANDWRTVYNGVYYCNLVLEKLDELEKKGKIEDRSRFNKVKGEALFLRGRRYLHAAWVWCLAYDAASADTDLGLPLRLGSNFNEHIDRSSLKETYSQIISDLKSSIDLLPEYSSHKTKASKPAALGVLARAYLSMRDYDNALLYSDSALQFDNELLNFNNLNINQDLPISPFGGEVIMSSALRSTSILSRNRLKVNTELVEMYEEDDLRKHIFFFQNEDGTYGLKAWYGAEGGTVLFNGPAINEMYLIRAESHCRLKNSDLALADLNKVLIHRFRSNTFKSLENKITEENLLNLILQERRKDLLFRGLRWIDVKRLNKEGKNVSFRRVVNGKEYMLPPNDKRAAMMLPRTVVDLGNYKQNPR